MSWFRRVKEKVNDEVDDLADDDRLNIHIREDDNVFKRLFYDLSKSSVAVQIVVGTVVGGCSGFLFHKFGSWAAIAVGCVLILIQVAHHQQWITVNWGHVDRRANRIRRQIKGSKVDLKRVSNTIELFVRENIFIAASFAGGFLIGLAAF